MNLYYVYRTDRIDYDEYDSCVVVAESEDQARTMVPGYGSEANREYWSTRLPDYPSWARSLKDVQVDYIGRAADDLRSGHIVCSSFNAG